MSSTARTEPRREQHDDGPAAKKRIVIFDSGKYGVSVVALDNPEEFEIILLTQRGDAVTRLSATAIRFDARLQVVEMPENGGNSVCIRLIEPPDGEILHAVGKVTAGAVVDELSELGFQNVEVVALRKI